VRKKHTAEGSGLRKRLNAIGRRQAIIAQLSEMSRNGWRDAREEDYLALERELREIDIRINWDRLARSR